MDRACDSVPHRLTATCVAPRAPLLPRSRTRKAMTSMLTSRRQDTGPRAKAHLGVRFPSPTELCSASLRRRRRPRTRRTSLRVSTPRTRSRRAAATTRPRGPPSPPAAKEAVSTRKYSPSVPGQDWPLASPHAAATSDPSSPPPPRHPRRSSPPALVLVLGDARPCPGLQDDYRQQPP